jgi:exosortase A-associated hydrolase 1
MTVRDTVACFDCAGERLVGIVSQSEVRASDIGIVIVVGGPQYRVGSHRQFALLARALARAGHAVMRFDCRGMGDSTGDAPGFDAIDADIAASIDALQAACPAVRRVVLWGLCDGASAALLYGLRTRDVRLAGFALANPWLHTEQAQAHAIVHARYRQRLREGAFWRKLVSGGINPLHKLGEIWRHWRAARAIGAVDQTAAGLLAALSELQQPMLLLLCRRDATAQAFLAQLQLDGNGFLARPHVHRVDFPDADHTFSRAEWRAGVEEETLAWLRAECCKT